MARLMHNIKVPIGPGIAFIKTTFVSFFSWGIHVIVFQDFFKVRLACLCIHHIGTSDSINCMYHNGSHGITTRIGC